ncbi:MAG: rRNA cytosine-C5-methyltransferase [Muribaculaceae bacterium]|nr:rRNA cytosine-C5-methyltransferase [Muribaculaceae bacterium]MDE6644233.1 rRNA cytosine-C5-methyltransferase [Muribaculaceae bacterium]
MPKLPDKFIEELKTINLPDGAADKLIKALTAGNPSVSVRSNRAKEYLPVDAVRKVQWCERGRYLDSRPIFTLMPQLHQGRFYVQDASSMFITEAVRHIVNQTDNVPLTVMDACAAPGGKTTAIIDALPHGSLVVANEYDRRRASILKENLTKWGNSNVLISTGDTDQYARVRDTFDIIAIDAPCSGEGMMRKEDMAVEQWSPGLVEECSQIQRKIIANLWDAIKPGGFLIYSTCTFNTRENEENVKWIIDNFDCTSVDLDITRFSGIIKTDAGKSISCYRFLPGLIEGEGLFMSIIQKSGELKPGIDQSESKRDKKSHDKAKLPIDQISKWVKPEFNLAFSLSDDSTTIEAISQDGEMLLKRLKKSGVKSINRLLTIASTKGKDLIPDHALAMSKVLAPDAFPCQEVDRNHALDYLRREAITVDPSQPRGYILLTFESHPLGFVKNLGNRTNNLYPQNWRILMNVR